MSRRNSGDIPPVWVNRFIYILGLWVVPGVFSLFAGFFALWILSDRASSPLWLEAALNLEAFMPVLYVVFGVWSFLFSSSPRGKNRETAGRKRLVLLWIVPLLLLATQIIITIISWDP
jgi:hypothetical protein